jgi:hypothetical protein
MRKLLAVLMLLLLPSGAWAFLDGGQNFLSGGWNFLAQAEPSCDNDWTLCLDEPDCTTAGWFWDGGRCLEAATCEHDWTLCLTEANCTAGSWFWIASYDPATGWGGYCNDADVTCAEDYSVCTTIDSCYDNGGYWDGTGCRSVNLCASNFRECYTEAVCVAAGWHWETDRCLSAAPGAGGRRRGWPFDWGPFNRGPFEGPW